MSFIINVEGEKQSQNERIAITKREQVELPLDIGHIVGERISDMLTEGYAIKHINVYMSAETSGRGPVPSPWLDDNF